MKHFKLDITHMGKKLKQIRIENRFVQDDLARFLGVTRNAYASIERGTYGTRIEVLANIILFYRQQGVTLDIYDLIGLSKDNGTKKETHDFDTEMKNFTKSIVTRFETELREQLEHVINKT